MAATCFAITNSDWDLSELGPPGMLFSSACFFERCVSLHLSCILALKRGGFEMLSCGLLDSNPALTSASAKAWVFPGVLAA